MSFAVFCSPQQMKCEKNAALIFEFLQYVYPDCEMQTVFCQSQQADSYLNDNEFLGCLCYACLTGPTCDTPACCLNGGTLQIDIQTMQTTCTCPTGFVGRVCDTPFACAMYSQATVKHLQASILL